MRAVSSRTALVAAVCGMLLAGCSDDQPVADQTRAAVTPAAASSAVVDLQAVVGQTVDVFATVSRVLHANAFAVIDGQVGTTPTLVIAGVLPPGIDTGKTVQITGLVKIEPPGSDPAMNEYKVDGRPIIEATDVQLR